MNLDPFQQEAAEQNNKYSVIIAGAGTGKTFTLIGRIQYLVNQCGFSPSEILVISYTNETVKDFSLKCQKLLGFQVTVMTFHKLAIHLLKLEEEFFQICDDNYLQFITQEFIDNLCKQNPTLKKYFQISKPLSYLFMSKSKSWNKDLKKQIVNFISLCKSKGFNENFCRDLINNNKGNKKAFFLLTYLVFSLYESEKDSQKLLDFDDIILKAIFNISKINIDLFPFRHILIDEFQDSSIVRIDLLYTLVKQFKMHFTVVGDDCQSIYRFSGTETNCFKILNSYFSNVQYYFLKYTYRNSQELVKVADQFVQKNKAQIKKNVISFVHLDFPIEILYYKNKKYIYKMISYVTSLYPNSSILFLGRNSFDWKYYFSLDEIIWLDYQHFRLKKISKIVFSFLTVHQSKGLEADVVILLHFENGIYGFPNQIKPYFFHKIFYGKDKLLFEEERRLFYVALTRTKYKIFLITPFHAPSIFAKELIQDFKGNIKQKYFFK